MKQQKVKAKQRRCNTLIDTYIKFKFDFGYEHKVGEEEIENSRRFVHYYEKSLQQKQEIKLNDYLKKELRRRFVKINVEFKNKDKFKYDVYTNILEKIPDFIFPYEVLLKETIIKNSRVNNKFYFKILKGISEVMYIGLCDDEYNPMTGYFGNPCSRVFIIDPKRYFEQASRFFYFDMRKYEKKEGDIYGIELNTMTGKIEMYFNGILNKTINVDIKNNRDYRFGISFGGSGDKIQILNQHEIKNHMANIK